MKKLFLPFLLFLSISLNAQNPVLIGYWHNWNASPPYIQLDQIDPRYNVICIAFAMPTSPSDMNMTFTPDGVSVATFKAQVLALQSQGKKVLLSVGGATASIALDNIANRDAFINTMTSLIDTYHFDGIDIDIENGNSIYATGGTTIANPTSPDVINFIYALKKIRDNFLATYNKPMMLTFAPETAYVQGGMSGYGVIWGGYLPILDALRNDLSYIHVQLYNSGSMYGVDGNIYAQGTADFIVAETEAVIRGFNTAGGFFTGIPANKVAVGLPACPSAAGGGFMPTTEVEAAIKYLQGKGAKPGSYTLANPAGYPNLAGMMTWSINWDKVNTCNATSYEYADNFQRIFLNVLPIRVNNFNAVLSNNIVNLSWQVNSQPNLDRFEIECSKDGSLFHSITTIKHVDIGTVKDYNYSHNYINKGKNFYRLKMVDKDGKAIYSDIRMVEYNFNDTIAIFPNPVIDVIHVNTSSNQQNIYRVLDVKGRAVLQGQLNSNKIIGVKSLSGGVYMLQVNGQSIRFSKL